MEANASSVHHCSDSAGGGSISFAFMMSQVVLLLPLSLLVLHLGLRRRRRQGCSASSSLADVVTFYLAVMDLVCVLGACLYLLGSYFDWIQLITLGFYTTSGFFAGQIFFHVLTCVERYLAVVQPVTYLGLRRSGGVRIRNLSVGLVWLLFCGWFGFQACYYPQVPYTPIFCLLTSSLVVVSFCSFSVLRVLIGPGPGEVGGARADQSKRRAFNTMAAVTAALGLFFLGFLLCVALERAQVLTHVDGCVLLMSAMWFAAPSTLILPVQFLHRTGRLLCCSRRH